MTSSTLPIGWTTAHKAVSQILTGTTVLARGMVAMTVFKSASFAFPPVFAVTFKVRNSVDAGAVVATRIRSAVVTICYTITFQSEWKNKKE